MPLPKKTIRVLPNPWGFIHHETGPQGHCHEDTGGRGSDPRYVGCDFDADKTVVVKAWESDKDNAGTRHNEQVTCFKFPALSADLVTPAKGFEEGIELPKTPYYLDRLRDGDLIPADARTAENPCRFATLAEARKSGIANFEAHYEAGSFAEICPELADKPAVAAPKAAATSSVKTATPSSDNGGQS